MPDSFFSRLAEALGVRDGADMRAETRTLVDNALAGHESSRVHLKKLLDEKPPGIAEALADATRDREVHKKARRSTPRAASGGAGVSPHWEARETYEGDQKEVVTQPLRLYEPETLEDLVFIVKEAEHLGHVVKALGAGCSYSGANATTGFLVDMKGLDGMLPIDPAVLSPGAPANLCRFQAGARLITISERLAAKGRALENMGGFLQLSFVGAATMGTHGSGIGLGDMASQIVSMVVVGSGGTVYRVEPKNGITDAGAWNEPGVDQLEQDDELFHSLRVSMGAMGLIYSVTVRTVPLDNLREVRWVVGWKEARQRLAQRTDLDAHDMVEVYVNPYKTRNDKDRNALITIRKSTNKAPKGKGGHRRFLPELLERLPFLGNVASLYLNLWPKKTPSFIDLALNGLCDDEYIDKRYKVLADDEHPDGFAMELSFSMKDDTYLDTIEEILDLLVEQSERGEQFLNMLSIRFVKASDDYLSMHRDPAGHPSCTLEFPTLSATVGAHESFRRIQRAMLARGARPHWAMEFGTLTGNGGLLEEMYPDLATWKKARAFFDATGVFANGFTDRMGFTVPVYQRN